MRDYADLSPAIAAALNPVIGYDAAASVAAQAMRERIPVAQVVSGDARLSPDELKRLDPLRLALWREARDESNGTTHA
jgi:fumarate hydratase class II